MKKSVKKSLEKSKNVVEEKKQNRQAKNLHKNKKTHTFTIIATNFVQEQLKVIQVFKKSHFLSNEIKFSEDARYKRQRKHKNSQ